MLANDQFSPVEKEHFMQRAVELAKRGKGLTAPNPCVGALLSRDGQIVAEGWHREYGREHAEIEALNAGRAKGENLSACSLWVTLEPCNHHGQTPPCTQAILDAGIKKVYIGTRDPNRNVPGKGIEFLRANGIQVETGIAEESCLDLISDFKLWQQEQRTYVYLKLATTLDGKIATRSRHSAWVSGEESRNRVHELRSRVQAVMVGSRTFYADNPSLTCRLNGLSAAKQPLAVICGSSLPKYNQDLYLIQKRPAQVIFWTSKKSASAKEAKRLQGMGARLWVLPELRPGQMDLREGFRRLLQELNVYYLLCEGGGRLAMSLAVQELVDEFYLFLAPKILGDEQGINAFSGRNIADMEQALNWRIASQEMLGEDLCLDLMPNREKIG